MSDKKMPNKYNPPFDITPKMLNLVVEICEVLACIKLDAPNLLVPHLRKTNCIKTIRASLAIENNSLSLEQVTAIINGKRILGNPREIKEVKNAYEAYEQIMGLKGSSLKHLLKAHALMMGDLIKDSGRFRDGGVGVVNQKYEVVHLAPKAEFVPQLMERLFDWYKSSEHHPLIKSSVFHYELEFIHPFSDGNGRLGRMWQSKLLGEWNEIFYFLPIEELIKEKQALYCQNLAKSDESGNSTSFVEYMLMLIRDSIHALNDDTIKDTINDTINANEKAVLEMLENSPKITRKAMAQALGLAVITIQRTLDSLAQKGKIERVGANKNGYYRVL